MIKVDSVSSDQPIISRYVYGQFAEHLGRCIYEGVWVGEDSAIENVRGIRQDVVRALRRIQVPVIRWPGGCFADEYHWEDGIGPREERAQIVNTNWGGVTENNHFGTHEYFELLDQVGADAYVNGNVGSGTVRQMQEWVEYMTAPGTSPMADLRLSNGRQEPWRLKFFGVGNENWGCGGNMRPEYYADLYRQYQTYVRQYGEHPIQKIACGSHDGNLHWTEVLMREAAPMMQGLSFHYYTLPSGEWEKKGSALVFSDRDWFSTINRALVMDDLLGRQSEIMDRYDPAKNVSLVVDEWGTWYDVEPGTNPGFLYQQNSMRDAMVAALTLMIFHKHAARVRMANIAQMVNVLQAMILTDGPQMITTPTYHVFDLMKDHHDARLVSAQGEPEDRDGELARHARYTVSFKDDAYCITAANYSLSQSEQVLLELPAAVDSVMRAEILIGTAPNSHNSFEAPQAVRLQELQTVVVTGTRVEFELPALAIATVRLKVV